MHTLLDQIEASLEIKQYYLSLFTALCIPDIAGALSSENGEATGRKYADWYEKWARPRCKEIKLASIPEHAPDSVRQFISKQKFENPFTGDNCYLFRCSLLHQGSSQHQKNPYTRILFVEPQSTRQKIGADVSMHYATIKDALCIDVDLFCKEITSGARLWLDNIKADPNYIRNSKRFARRYDNGLSPYIDGIPVVS
ncbi:hypothetical protein [Methylosinus sp. R-45379]|uniref:hypothetical protein n=1 Tax=Methylosinus sp. R-45379 TaxID=980563 RepID=UPI0009FC1510|nr:hypothetical protein [Methylosinus sp. R-45379]